MNDLDEWISERVFNKHFHIHIIRGDYAMKAFGTHLTKEEGKIYGSLCIAYFAAYLAIIRADFSYADDVGRKLSGYHGWSDWSRWTTTILSNFIHADWYLSDISPLPQILSCFLMASTSLMLIWLLTGGKKVTVFTWTASLLAGLCPYFLGCISYKYDSVYMALAIWISVFPLLFREKKYWKYLLSVITSIVIMCTTYQPAAGIFPMMVSFTLLQELIEGKSRRLIRNELISSLCGYILGMLLFRFVFMKLGDTDVFPPKQMFSGVAENYLKYWKLILSDFRKVWLLLLAFLVVSFVWGEMRLAVSYGYSCIKTAIMSLTVLLFSAAVMFGANPLMVRFADDTRCMLGFGIFVAAIAIVSAAGTDRIRAGKIAVILLFWCWFTFSFTYGNAMAEQKRYNDFRIQMLISDMKDVNGVREAKVKGPIQIMFVGNAGFSPVIRNMENRGNILTRLLRDETLGEGGSWINQYLLKYFDLPNAELVEPDAGWEDMPVVKDDMYQTVTSLDNRIKIEIYSAQ